RAHPRRAYGCVARTAGPILHRSGRLVGLRRRAGRDVAAATAPVPPPVLLRRIRHRPARGAAGVEQLPRQSPACPGAASTGVCPGRGQAAARPIRGGGHPLRLLAGHARAPDGCRPGRTRSAPDLTPGSTRAELRMTLAIESTDLHLLN